MDRRSGGLADSFAITGANAGLLSGPLLQRLRWL